MTLSDWSATSSSHNSPISQYKDCSQLETQCHGSGVASSRQSSTISHVPPVRLMPINEKGKRLVDVQGPTKQLKNSRRPEFTTTHHLSTPMSTGKRRSPWVQGHPHRERAKIGTRQIARGDSIQVVRGAVQVEAADIPRWHFRTWTVWRKCSRKGWRRMAGTGGDTNEPMRLCGDSKARRKRSTRPRAWLI